MMTLKEVLMQNHDMTEAEAIADINEARAELMEEIGNGGMPMDFCQERWGLEPDYLEELIF